MLSKGIEPAANGAGKTREKLLDAIHHLYEHLERRCDEASNHGSPNLHAFPELFGGLGQPIEINQIGEP